MKRLCAAALFALLAGCVSAPAPSCVRLAVDGWFCPLPPSALAPRGGTDLVTVRRGGTSRHYVGQLSVTPGRLTLALTNLAGVPLAVISWDGRKAQVQPATSRLKPGLMVALLELSLAPTETLRGALHGIVLSEHTNRGGAERRLSAGGTLVARAVTKHGVTQIDVPREAVTIRLRALEAGSE